MPNNPSTARIHIGASYYPEHWLEHRWADDIQLMDVQELQLEPYRVAILIRADEKEKSS